jgi:phage tail sheath protein FI
VTAPGVTIIERVALPGGVPPTNTGTFFVVAAATQGPTAPKLIQSLDQLVQVYGARDPIGGLYDAADVFFREAGNVGQMYVARVTGAGSVSATRTLKDASVANTLTVTANGPGTWGNSLNVGVLAGTAAGTYVLQILIGATEVERSPDLTTVADAVNWAAQTSKYITAVAVGTNGVPAVAAPAALSGGTDVAVADSDFVTALDLFASGLGPGQVAAPGRTSSTVQLALLAHASTNNRFALIDLVDTPTVATLTGAVTSLAGVNARYGSAFAPWVQVQGVAFGTTRLVPPSPVVAGMMARVDATDGAGTPAAGEKGQSATAIGLSQDYRLKSDRDTLSDGGVDIFRLLFGGVRLYGYRTVANPSSQQPYIQASQVRYIMSAKARLRAASEAFVFRKIDARGHLFIDFQGALQAVLLDDYNLDELYGATPAAAFAVDVGPSVNTDQTIANGELHAVVAIHVTPFAERVIPELAKIPITVPLAA